MDASGTLPGTGVTAPDRRAALLAMGVATLVWGVNFPVMKFVVTRIDPFFVAGLRIPFGAAVFVLLIPRHERRGLLRGGSLGKLLLLSLTGIVVNQVFVLTGLERTTVGHSAVLMALIPIFVALFALWWLRERLSVAGWTGILFGAAGAAGVVASSAHSGGQATLLGDALTLVATLAFAIYTVLGRDLVRATGARRVLAGAYLGALPVGFVLLGVGFGRQAARGVEVGLDGVAALLYVLFFNTVVCYLLYFWALRTLRAAEVAVFSNFQPVLGTALSFAFGMETIGPLFLASGAVVLVGVWIVQARGSAEHAGYTRER